MTVGFAYGQMEAALACSMLEAAGISVVAGGRDVAAIAWQWTLAFGGVALLVPASQAADAHDILAGFQPAPRRRSIWVKLLGLFVWLWVGAPLPPSGHFAVQRSAVATLVEF